MDRSFWHEVVFELHAISVTLSSENGNENGNHNVINFVGWVLDDGVSKKQDNSDVLGAVGGQKEVDSFPFNGISDLDSGLVGVALVEHFLSFLNKSQNFNLGVEVIVLNG